MQVYFINQHGPPDFVIYWLLGKKKEKENVCRPTWGSNPRPWD